MEQLFQQAVACQKAGRLDEAEVLYLQVVAWRPCWVLTNLGAIYRSTGRLEEAEAVLRRAMAAEPDAVGPRHTLGMTLLQLGRYAEGWPLYEARHQMYDRATREFREWQGESLRGKRILVLAEQGFGDQILWARFLPLLAGQASEVLLAASRALMPLFRQLPVTLVEGSGWQEATADVWTSFGSVPRWLEAGPDDAPAPYLSAQPSGRGTSGIGLMLDGGTRNPNMARLPPPSIQRALRGLADFTDLDPAASGAASFAETAAVLAGLEGVVSVDTAVAHLAGAMGVPGWTLLPRPAMDWYARWEGGGSPWYPAMRTVRQREAGDWAGVLSDLATSLGRAV